MQAHPAEPRSLFLSAAIHCELALVERANGRSPDPHLSDAEALLLQLGESEAGEEEGTCPATMGVPCSFSKDDKFVCAACKAPPPRRLAADPLVLALAGMRHDLREEDVEAEAAYTAAGRATAGAQKMGSLMGKVLLGACGRSAAAATTCTMPLFASGEKPGAISAVINLARLLRALHLPNAATYLLQQQLLAMEEAPGFTDAHPASLSTPANEGGDEGEAGGAAGLREVMAGRGVDVSVVHPASVPGDWATKPVNNSDLERNVERMAYSTWGVCNKHHASLTTLPLLT